MTWLLANWKLVAIGLVLAISHAFVYRAGGASERSDFDAYKLANQQQSELQRESNRGRSYKAEEKQAAQTIYRDRYITKTTEEVNHATQSLAAVPVPDDARRLLNAAAQCAREDRPASCGAGDGVSGPP